jgi:hypothetical protein
MAEKLILNQAYFIARQYVQQKPVAWDDLNSSISLWSYLEDGMTEAEVLKKAEIAYQARVTEDGKDDIQV